MELTTWTRSWIATALVIILFSWSSFACPAEDTFPPKELTFHDGFGSKKGDRRTYVLTGCCWIRGIRSGDPDQFASAWLAQHPFAAMRLVSRMPIEEDEWVFIWIEDRASSLNVDMVRAGMYPAAAMADMVDNDKGLTEILKSPKLAYARVIVEKERAQNPQRRPTRVESVDEYNRHVDACKAAEIEARKQKIGIWSDAMKEERESLGLP
jgi:hypothetical protein